MALPATGCLQLLIGLLVERSLIFKMKPISEDEFLKKTGTLRH